MIRNRYNRFPYPAQNTKRERNTKNYKSAWRKNAEAGSQEVSFFPADCYKAVLKMTIQPYNEFVENTTECLSVFFELLSGSNRLTISLSLLQCVVRYTYLHFIVFSLVCVSFPSCFGVMSIFCLTKVPVSTNTIVYHCPLRLEFPFHVLFHAIYFFSVSYLTLLFSTVWVSLCSWNSTCS